MRHFVLYFILLIPLISKNVAQSTTSMDNSTMATATETEMYNTTVNSTEENPVTGTTYVAVSSTDESTVTDTTNVDVSTTDESTVTATTSAGVISTDESTGNFTDTTNSAVNSTDESTVGPATMFNDGGNTTDMTTDAMTTATTTAVTSPPPVTMPTVARGNGLGSNCSEDSNCSHPTAQCIDDICSCMSTYFQYNDTVCVKESRLQVSVSVHNRTTNNMYITWNDPDFSMFNFSYTVRWHNAGITSFNSTNVSDSTGALLWNLTPGELYNITVTTKTVAFDGRAVNVMSEVARHRTIPAQPVVTTNTDELKGERVTLQWSVQGSFLSFHLFLTTGMSSQSFTTTSLSQMVNVSVGQNYTLMLWTNGGPTDPQNSTVTVVTFNSDPDVPGPPSGVTAVNISQMEFSLLVEDPELTNGNLIGYLFDIEYLKYKDSSNIILTNELRALNENRTYLFNESVIPGAFYTASVTAVNEFFNGTERRIIQFQTLEDVPSKVVNLMARGQVNNVYITWTRPEHPNGNIVEYHITISEVNEATNCHFVRLCNGSCRFVGNGPNDCQTEDVPLYPHLTTFNKSVSVPQDRSYTASVNAFTSVGGGMLENVTFMTAAVVPNPPTNVKATHYSLARKSLILRWDAPQPFPGDLTYKVFVRDEIEGTSRITCSAITSTTCEVSLLEEYWTYSFVVEAMTSKGSSNSTVFTKLTPVATFPGKITDLVYNTLDCETLTISWKEPALRDRNGPISEYRIKDLKTRQITKIDARTSNDWNPVSRTFTASIPVEGGQQYRLQVFPYYTGASMNAVSISVTIVECGPEAGAIVGLVLGFIVLLAVALGVVFFIYKRKVKQLERRYPIQTSPDTAVIPMQPQDDEEIESERPFVLADVKEIFIKKSADQNRIFSLEYDDVKKLSPKHPAEVANLEGSNNTSGNKPKNRYVNILPFDHSRVTLSLIDDDKCSDYINANYIPGYTFEREYIASQGPLPGTVVDFWRMIWEKSITIVVMLTKCKEGNADKCEHYWPNEVNEPKEYGNVVVNMVSVSNMDKFDINIFHVTQGDYTRTVKHFHFLEWPDFSASVSSTVVIDFTQTVRTHITPEVKGPVLVHCSAGVGRTGTFISVDYLLQMVRDSDLSTEVDIFDWVLQMRNNRSSMVQVEKQYIFIHQALVELVERKQNGLIKSEDIDVKIANDIVYENQAYEGDDDDEDGEEEDHEEEEEEEEEKKTDSSQQNHTNVSQLPADQQQTEQPQTEL